MQVILIRHGSTQGNLLRRYIGSTDEPLSAEGIRQAQHFPAFFCKEVVVSPMLRARQTAQILFPEARQRVAEGLREMDFGAFENRSADEMADDAAYRAWVESGCMLRCPQGESREEFASRVCASFQEVLEKLAGEGLNEAVFVLHGGSIMAILEHFGRPRQDFYAYHLENCQAYRCKVERAVKEDMAFILTEIIREGRQ